MAGSPDLYETVEKLVTDLENSKPPAGSQKAIVIPVKNVPARDVQRVLEQIIEQQTGKR